MAGEGDGKKADSEPEYKKWNVIIGSIGGVLAILTGVQTLTGVDLLKEIGVTTSRSAAPATTKTPYSAVRAESVRRPEPPVVVTTRPRAPEFHLTSSDWDGPCGEHWCAMSAVFRNYGGHGSGSAVFYVLRQDENTYLARCSVVLPATAENELTKVGCTASSGQLQQYFRAYQGATVRMDVRVVA
ncbi:hypothetical protein SAMN05216553_12069 [Lentzea fradiae]|uniref:Uncharacterized protein n=1 Tax=Lentzea fradiae TaxID=200378 RepID=A0A1G8BUY8_9PSEU|nr:hypothetical protein [Lentzea fradiae]SDH37017.1 hypothetical protein SAMN05216553_12069 [Lentzea fradiae]